MDDMQNIQWFPGHMTRTRRRIQACLPLIDAVAEVVDARIPQSSRNPELDALTPGKPRLVILNKEDMADGAATALWMDWFREQGAAVMAADCKGGKGVGQFTPLLRRLLADKIAQWTEKGMPGHPIRVMVAGIPNSGKSSLINRLSKGGKAKVEDRPGVTRDQRWFNAGGGIELLDTPGVLWPKFEDQTVARRLAFTGAIRDQVLDGEGLACALLDFLRDRHSEALRGRYRLSGDLPAAGPALLEEIGRRRGMLVAGGEVDTERAAAMVLDEFRAGKLGRLTLELPTETGKKTK